MSDNTEATKESTEAKEPEVTVQQALDFAAEQDLESVVILGKRKPTKDNKDPFFMYTIGEYDYPPQCFWILSIAMDVVKEVSRQNLTNKKDSVIISPHSH